MASIGVVNAETPKTQNPNNTTARPKKYYFGVFFDGTSNNMIQRKAAEQFRDEQKKLKNSNWEMEINTNLNKYGANSLKDTPQNEDNDYSNVAILHSVYQGLSPNQLQEEQNTFDVFRYNIYVEGPGKSAINKDTNTQDVRYVRGSSMGKGDTGVASLVSKAVRMVKTRLSGIDLSTAEVHFHVIGFSRGAAGARLFSHLVVRKNGDTLDCESEFDAGKFLHFLDDINVKSKTVDFLGIFDTVSSIGMSYENNVTDYGLYSPNESNVLHTFHLCALDEFRDHFAITDIGQAASKGTNAEIFIPGCHSDVGGGYITGQDAFILNYNSKLFISSPQNTNGEKMTLDNKGSVLSVLGWYDKSNNENELILSDKTTTAICRRNVNAGYSNIPLKMMSERAIIETGHSVFAMNAIGQTRFCIPLGIKELGKRMVEYAKTATGRKFYFPSNTYLYKSLRNKYLHFSSTDRYTEKITDLAMYPCRHKGVICRILYTGNKGSKTEKHLCDYNL